MAERYRYAQEVSPPAPFVYVSISRPDDSGPIADDVPAQVDSASDYTILPEALIEQLGLAQVGQLAVKGFSGVFRKAPTYLVLSGLKNRERFRIRVLGDRNEPWTIVGRDVLNRFCILLDGPNEWLEVE